MGISPLISGANWLAGFCIVRVFTERYFLKRLLCSSICLLCLKRWKTILLVLIFGTKRKFFKPFLRNYFYYDLLRKYKFSVFIIIIIIIIIFSVKSFAIFPEAANQKCSANGTFSLSPITLNSQLDFFFCKALS